MPQQTENTLVIIKPDYFEKRIPILQFLDFNGFRVTLRKIISFSPEQAAEFYKDVEKIDPCFALKVRSLSKGRAEAVILNRVNAVQHLLWLLTSPSCSQLINAGMEWKIHASLSEKSAKNEIRYIFPNVILEPPREIHFGAYCGRENLTGLFADATFDAFENKTEDLRAYTSDWLLTHSYKFESDNWCDQ